MEQPQQPLSFNSEALDRSFVIATLKHNIKNGANNFYWIAGMSVLNSLISTFEGGITFVIGLGTTQLVDAFAMLFAQDVPEAAIIFKGIGIGISIVISAIFAIFGLFAIKAKRWAFITGMILYALDGVLLLLFQDWFGALFHLIFLWGLWKGLQALNQLQKLENSASGFPQDIGVS